MTIEYAQDTGMRILETGLDRMEAYLEQEPSRWTDETYDKIFDVRLQMKNIGKNRLGYCRYKDSLICVNYTHSVHKKMSEFIDTILHELAHHIAHVIYGAQNIKPHGKEWQDICTIIGANPQATYKE